MFGFKTIPQGQRAAIWDRTGRMRLIDGPRRLFLIDDRVEPLARYAAAPHQYLIVRFKDGQKEHLRGPASVWLDPVLHEAISVEPAIPIDANESVVVYRQENETVQRRIVRGPEVFVPQPNEWVHQFSWHGADPKNPQRKLPSALRFFKLRVIPDQMYFDVEDVRTADDALVIVKVMIFFELVDIALMLDQTHDPVGDFINALSADVIDFIAAQTFEKFKEKTEQLNELATYPQLIQRAQRIGYRINKVVYRGYHASDKLQRMHDDAIEARTRLKLESETESQAQEIADLKLERESERAVERRKMEETETAHKNQMMRMQHEEQMRQQRTQLEQRLEARRLRGLLKLQHQEAQHREQSVYYKTMQEMQVDLTRYLVARYQNPDRLIRIDGNGRKPPQLHLHE